MTADEQPATPADVPVPPLAPSTDPAAQAMAAVTSAVTGPGTPSSAHVTTKPDERTTWALVLAGPAVSLMIIGLVMSLVFVLWPDAVVLKALGVMGDVVRVLGILAGSLAAILGIIVFRLASGGLKKVEAKAGPAGINIETGG